MQARIEVDELKMKLNTEYSDKVADLEMQVQFNKDELRKKE